MKKIILLLFSFLIVGCQNKGITVNLNKSDNFEVKTYFSYNNEQLLIDITNNDDKVLSFNVETNLEYEQDSYNNNLNWNNLEAGKNAILYLDIDKEQKLKRIDINVQEIDEQENFDEQEIKSNLETSYEVFDDMSIDINIKNKLNIYLAEVDANVVFYKDNIPIYVQKIYAMDFEDSFIKTIDIPKINDNIIDCDDVKIYINDIILNYEDEEKKQIFIESSEE